MANKNIGHARILQQIRNINKQKLQYLKAQPLQNDIYTWHFTIQGPQGTDFHQGLYHGQIFLPFQYPFKPPDIVFNNKNGRFQVDTKICLTITQYHPDQWNSAWTIRTMLEAVISLFNEKVIGVGYVESSSQVRKYLAKASHQYVCQKCGVLKNILKPRQPKLSEKKVEEQQSIEDYGKQYEKMQYRKVSSKRQEKVQEKQKVLENQKVKKEEVYILKKRKKRVMKEKQLKGIDYFLDTMSRGTKQYSKVIESIRYVYD